MSMDDQTLSVGSQVFIDPLLSHRQRMVYIIGDNGQAGSPFKQDPSGNTQSLNPDRFGDPIGGNTALSGSLTTVADFLWDNGPKSACTLTFGASSGSVYKGNTSGNAGTWTAPCVGLGMQNQSTNLSAGAVEVVWSDVVITVEVIDL